MDPLPQRPKLAHFLFADDHLPQLREQHPYLRQGELRRLVNSMWRDAPDDVKDRYRDKYRREFEAYERAEWEANQRRRNVAPNVVPNVGERPGARIERVGEPDEEAIDRPRNGQLEGRRRVIVVRELVNNIENFNIDYWMQTAIYWREKAEMLRRMNRDLAQREIRQPKKLVPVHMVALLLKSSPEDRECPICKETIDSDMYMTPCYHLFHLTCVQRCDVCPICRENI